MSLDGWKYGTAIDTMRAFAQYLRSNTILDASAIRALASELDDRAEFFAHHTPLPSAEILARRGAALRHLFADEVPWPSQHKSNVLKLSPQSTTPPRS